MRARLLVCLALFAFAGPAAAEIYECRGPDGKTIFTTQEHACPGVAPRKLEREVQRVSPGPHNEIPPAARGPRAPGPEVEAAQAAHWRSKKDKAQQERSKLQRSAQPYTQIVKWCNRGASMHARDRNGVPIEDYDCDKARAEHDRVQKRLAHLEHYLDSGLAEECRRAGCLPGWIR